jgi:hypothetical protein
LDINSRVTDFTDKNTGPNIHHSPTFSRNEALALKPQYSFDNLNFPEIVTAHKIVDNAA